MPATPAITLQPGAALLGFVVRRVTELPNLRAVAYELEHGKTGARIFHLHTADPENLFCVTFPTPPTDDTGLPHILEHSVLGGSRRFKVKDPFFEMIKSSMATFINAMTGSDQTLYPVSSNVRQDFYNLVEVYFDAVFHPTLAEHTFQREGHHLELADKTNPQSDLLIKGIVYNEMKGVYSSPDSLLYRHAFNGLFPDTPYGHESGGDPEAIPTLTYQDFVRFHQSHYHPTPAYFFFYGDIATADHLEFLKERLEEFDRLPAQPPIPVQPRWTEPKVQTEFYPLGISDPTKERTYITLGWIVGRAIEAPEVMALKALATILLGNQGAPLRKAIIDSKLGQDLAFSFFNADTLQTTFHIGLKGSEMERREAFEKLVLETLAKIAAEGIPAALIDTALQQLAYQYLEIQSMFPLHMLDRTMQAWLHGGDPLTFLRADQLLRDLKARCQADPQVFSRLIRERLLDNPHRLTLVLAPDPGLQGRKDAALVERLRARKAALQPADLQQIAATTAQLERLENTPNSAVDLAALPHLLVRDLPGKPKHIPTSIETVAGKVQVLHNDVFANGVNYLQLDFDLTGLPDELYPYLPLYADCVRKMGAAGMDYAAAAQRVASCTGGMSFAPYLANTVTAEDTPLRRARFFVKSLDDKLPQALEVLHDFVFEVDPSDTGRLADVVTQAKAGHISNIANSGAQIAALHAGRGFTAQAALGERMGAGLPQLRMMIELANTFAAHREEVVAKLMVLRGFLRNANRLIVSFTGSDPAYERVKKALGAWVSQMAVAPIVAAPVGFQAYTQLPREGLAAPMDVAYCAQVFPAPHISHPDAPLLVLGSSFLSLNYMLDEIRFKGTAYGAWSRYDGPGSSWGLGSYRDPWVTRTLNVFANILDHARKTEWTQPEIDRAIISTAKEGERPIRPEAATGTALHRHLTGNTPERREAFHAALLAATAPNVRRAVLEALEANLPKSAICVVSSREKLARANSEAPAAPLAVEDILLPQV